MNAHKEAVRSYNKYEEEVCAKKGKGISIIKGRAGEGVRVHNKTIEEKAY